MRYATFERDGRVSWGVVQSGGVLDLPAAAAAAGLAGWPETLLAFIQSGSDVVGACRPVRGHSGEHQPTAPLRGTSPRAGATSLA